MNRVAFSRMLVTLVVFIQVNLVFASPFRPQFEDILKNATQHTILKTWLAEHITDQMKHGVDRKVHQILRESKVIQELLVPLLLPILKEETVERRARLLLQTAKAKKPVDEKPGQYAAELELAEQSARRLDFSEEVIQNISLFIAPISEVNAFTYSTVESIDVVLFQGIVDVLSPAELKAVLGHEIGHVKFQHILNQFLVITVFLATGESIIPESEQIEFKEKIKEQLFNFIEHTRFVQTTDSNESMERLFFQLDVVAQKLRNKLDPKNLLRLANQLGNTLGAEKKSRPSLSKEDIEKFVGDLERYSRSCETSADRAGLFVTDLPTAVSVDVILSGGKSVTWESMSRQLEDFQKLVAENPGLEEKARQAQGTHPAGLLRAKQYELLAKDLSFQALTDPFLKGLSVYIKVLSEVESLRAVRAGRKSEMLETIQLVQLETREQLFKGLEKALFAELTRVISEGVKASPPDLTYLKKFMAYIADLERRGEELPDKLFEAGGLATTVRQSLREHRKKLDPAFVQQALKLISMRGKSCADFLI